MIKRKKKLKKKYKSKHPKGPKVMKGQNSLKIE